MLGLLKPTSFFFLLVLLLSIAPFRSLFPLCCSLGDGEVSSLYVHVDTALSFPLFSRVPPWVGPPPSLWYPDPWVRVQVENRLSYHLVSPHSGPTIAGDPNPT